jgi:hypothetical protein
VEEVENLCFKEDKMKVICINDKNQPQGAEVVEGVEYTVLDDFMNDTQQKVYLIKGVCNEGTTKIGFPWYGYAAERFAKLDKASVEAVEYDFSMN